MVSQTASLVSLQDQVNGIRSDISGLNAGLDNIGTLIRNDSALENIRLREEEQQERSLLQQQVRVGKEEEIQRKIDASIAAPIESVESKVNDTFGGIEKALTALFFGSLATVAVRGFSFASNELSEGIDQTKDFIEKTLGFITNSISTISSGFDSVFDVIGNITKGIKDIATNLTKSPIEAISKAFSGLFGGGDDGQGGPEGGNQSGGPSLFQNFSSLLKDFSASQQTSPPPSSSSSGGGIRVAFDESSSSSSGSNQSSSSPLNMGNFLTGVNSAMMDSPVFKGMSGESNLNQENFTMPGGMNVDKMGMFDFNTNIADSFTNMASGVESMLGQPAPTVQVPVQKVENPTIDSQGKPIPLEVIPYKPPTQQKTELKPPEKKPDIIYTSSISQQQEQQQQVMTSPEDVPFIPSSNTDNFYVLYSQLNYNVVM